MRTLLLLLLASCALPTSTPDGGGPPTDAGPAAPVRLDCSAAGGACPPLAVLGDAPAGPGEPVRGYADPSVRREPGGTRLWLAYSMPRLDGALVRVDNHLASSDDLGRTWRFERLLWRSAPETEPSGGIEAGFSNHETVSLAPREVDGGARWYYARMRYFTRSPQGYQFASFHTRVGVADAPGQLADGPEAEEGVLGGALTPAAWGVTTRLSALSVELAGCTFFDAGALWHQGRLWLAVQCLRFTDAGTEDPARDLVAAFSTDAAGPPRAWSWRFEGVLATAADAAALGGQALMQAELAPGLDGGLLLLVTPSRAGGLLAAHDGCRALEVRTLAPPALARDPEGAPVVRAALVDDAGTGACGYEPAGEGGVLMMRRSTSPGHLVGELVQSGLHP